MSSFKFIDLFAGIGGFHQAMAALGGECVFACDINKDCRSVYKKNFCPNEEFPVEGDINNFINEGAIAQFDVLCGGFPCQTFSKAGKRTGFCEVDERGQLFFRIIDILTVHPECKFVILENVRNLADNEDNWNVVCTELRSRGFVITEEPIIETPTNFGIPQKRDRVYILGIRKDLFPDNYQITREMLNINNRYDLFKDNCINWIKDKNIDKKYFLEKDKVQLLEIWEEFLQELQKTNTIKTPFWLTYAGVNEDDFEHKTNINYNDAPEWKKILIDKTRNMYLANKEFIDSWNAKYNMRKQNKIYQKFEWNASKMCKSIKEGVIQFRQSGIRVKNPTYFPSLVAMNNTPIIWDNDYSQYRYLTVKECAKLQSFNSDYLFSDIDSISYRQLGNSVNVKVIRTIAKELFRLGGLSYEEKIGY